MNKNEIDDIKCPPKSEASELMPLLGGRIGHPNPRELQIMANAVCMHIPPGYVISLCMEEGAAFVQLGKDGVGFINLPDSTDKTLLEQLNDALCVANGWAA